MTTTDGPRAARLLFAEESEPVPAATVTLIEGASFVICGSSGDIAEGGVEGLFVADTRLCSRLSMTIDGSTPEPLVVNSTAPYQALFVARSRDHELLVFREVQVGRGMRLDVRVRNLTSERRVVVVELLVRADLADVFAVKEGRVSVTAAPAQMRECGFAFADAAEQRGLVVTAKGDVAVDSGRSVLSWTAQLEPRSEWAACVDFAPVRGGGQIEPRYVWDQPSESSLPASRQARWAAIVPRLETDIAGLERAFARAADDLGALRLFDPDHPEEPVIAAGAPWFMTLFGRDSILTSWMALMLDPALALSTVRTLARLQGTRDDPASDEQPGRILHEVRFSTGPSLALADGELYYGTADATALFVMLVHELWRWGVPFSELGSVLPAVDRALDWMERFGDSDGDGYIEYAPRSARSLANQAWKDSHDGISYADGRIAVPPLAVAEVQAYAYAAWNAGAALAEAAGDSSVASLRRVRAVALQERFERDFWLADRGAFALALDADKRPVDAIGSNMGHCLWSGIVKDRDQARSVARWLVSPELFSGWGIRTLATSMGRFNPLSYHNGSVWPHDTAICIAGLRREGFVDEALEVASGLLRAAAAFDGRLPELFAGITPDDVATPVPYPASCSPQAWSSAAPLLVLRSLLGLEPDMPNRCLTIDPVLPAAASRLRATDLPIGGEHVTIEVEGDAVAVRGLRRTLTLVRPATS